MRPPLARIGLVGSMLLVTSVGPSCALRVGKGPPGDGSDTGQVFGVSACQRVGGEKKLPFGAGATAFAVTWDTDHYVVVYADPSTGDGDIYAAKLSKDGSVVGGPVVVEATPAASDLPSVIKTQAGYMVVWQEGSAGLTVYAHALGPDATPVGSGVTIAATQASQARPVLARTPGGAVAVSWMDTFDGKGGVELAVVDPSSLNVLAQGRIAEADID